MPPARDAVDVLVIAPHPDDEQLLAAGVMRDAVERGERVAIIVMTNGDDTCERNGYVREVETINAAELVGVRERDIHFLGYPDGDLSVMGAQPLPLLDRRDARGKCVRAAWTYASRGANGRDEHSARTGRPAEYIAKAVTEDLAALLVRLRPRDIYVTHGIDEHPDHAATYAYLRRALDLIDLPPITVHRGVVHAGPCWPGACAQPYQPAEKVPPLPAPRDFYLPTDRRPVNPQFKLQVISQFVSQTGSVPTSDWLSSFARVEETFYPEKLVRRSDGQWLRPPAPGQEPFELALEFHHFPLITLMVSRGDGVEQFELLRSHDRMTLNRVEEWSWERVGSWPRPYTESTTLRLRIDPRPDDGAVSEWSLWGDEGFIGQTVMTPAMLKVEARPTIPMPEQAWAPESGLRH